MPPNSSLPSPPLPINRMCSLAWRPYLGPAMHYGVSKGNGRFSFCQSGLLEMQNTVRLSFSPCTDLHCPFGAVRPSSSCHHQWVLLGSCFHPSTSSGVRKSIPDPVPFAKSEWALCQSETPLKYCSSPLHQEGVVDETWSRPSSSHKALSWVRLSPQSATQTVVGSASHLTKQVLLSFPAFFSIQV